MRCTRLATPSVSQTVGDSKLVSLITIDSTVTSCVLFFFFFNVSRTAVLALKQFSSSDNDFLYCREPSIVAMVLVINKLTRSTHEAYYKLIISYPLPAAAVPLKVAFPISLVFVRKTDLQQERCKPKRVTPFTREQLSVAMQSTVREGSLERRLKLRMSNSALFKNGPRSYDFPGCGRMPNV